jgi:hypothetical protein
MRVVVVMMMMMMMMMMLRAMWIAGISGLEIVHEPQICSGVGVT